MKKHKYYIFDCDDNLLHLDTVTTVVSKETGKIVKWTSEQFSEIKKNNLFHLYEPLQGDWAISYREFGDENYDGEPFNRFERDVRRAIEAGESSRGPSYYAFVKCVSEGHIFGILTARGHESGTLKCGLRALILEGLDRQVVIEGLYNFLCTYYPSQYKLSDVKTNIDEYVNMYLDHCVFVGISSPAFMKKHSFDQQETIYNGKKVAIEDIVKYFVSITPEELRHSKTNPISIGFSDDDILNQDSARDKILDDLVKHHPEVKFCLYKTHNKGYTKEVLYNPN